jgi:glycosyltransferase involved in cell wall biosynthesis
MEDAFRVSLRKLSLLRPSVRRSHRAADIVFAQNQATGREIDRNDVRVLSNALSVSTLVVDSHQESRSKDVIFAGKLVGWKGGTLAIEAMRYVTDPAARLHIYGKGPDAARLQALARRWNLSDRIRFGGMISREELSMRLGRAAALVHPALHEEAGAAISEALALGTPVICLNRGGPAVLVQEWPDVPSHLIRVSTRGQTTRDIAAAIDIAVAEPAPIPPSPLDPATDFAQLLSDAYDEVLLKK